MQSFQGISNFPKIFSSSCYLQLADFFDVYWNSPASQDFDNILLNLEQHYGMFLKVGYCRFFVALISKLIAFCTPNVIFAPFLVYICGQNKKNMETHPLDLRKAYYLTKFKFGLKNHLRSS